MRVPLSWLREYCDPGMEPAALADRLVMTGTEVERIETVGPPSVEGFVVGKVLEREQHPNADRLGSTPARASERSSAALPTSTPARPWRWCCPERRCRAG
jgi:phenylalanyl-tRNA synthetase beta chain